MGRLHVFHVESGFTTYLNRLARLVMRLVFHKPIGPYLLVADASSLHQWRTAFWRSPKREGVNLPSWQHEFEQIDGLPGPHVGCHSVGFCVGYFVGKGVGEVVGAGVGQATVAGQSTAQAPFLSGA